MEVLLPIISVILFLFIGMPLLAYANWYYWRRRFSHSSEEREDLRRLEDSDDYKIDRQFW